MGKAERSGPFGQPWESDAEKIPAAFAGERLDWVERAQTAVREVWPGRWGELPSILEQGREQIQDPGCWTRQLPLAIRGPDVEAFQQFIPASHQPFGAIAAPGAPIGACSAGFPAICWRGLIP
jgi:hypothetical protein